MSEGLVTSRLLRNEATGLDLLVPLYQEIRGPAMTGHVEYQIVVVTHLPFFKSTEHKAEDVLQFAVPKTYSEIEKLYCSIRSAYPSVSLPAIPRKALFVGETDLCRRRSAFDELFKFLSKHQSLAHCPELLEFLGADTKAVDVGSHNKLDQFVNEMEDALDFFGSCDASNSKNARGSEASERRLRPSEEHVSLDPLGSERLKKTSAKVVSENRRVLTKKAITLFDEEEPAAEGVFPDAGFNSADSDSTDPELVSERHSRTSAETEMDPDFEELFRVDEELGKLLAVKRAAAAAQEHKPEVKAKPRGAGPASDPDLRRLQAMDQTDILRYIQLNAQQADEDLELFTD